MKTSRARLEDVLLVIRTPPPYGGGEMIGLQLERAFAGKYAQLTFRRVRHRKAVQGRLTLSNIIFAARFVLSGSRRLLADRPKVMFIDVPKDAPSFIRTSVLLALALALRVRIVGDLAGADFQFLRRTSAIGRYGRWLLPRLHRIRVLGTGIESTLRDQGLENAVVIPNGIAEPSGAAEAAEARTALGPAPRFLYVGKISRSKGILTLLEFMKLASVGGASAQLHVVGEWENDRLRQEVLERIAADDLADHIEFHGVLIEDEKWELFRSADVLLHPSSWDGQPVTILEALAFGLPVVATDVGAIPDTIRSGIEGYLMTENSPEEVAAGVRTLTADGDTYAAFAWRARQRFLECFTLKSFETAISGLLDEALRSHTIDRRRVGTRGDTDKCCR
jgi:glycosyltransferase involved in cell wall biosynthesis